MSIGPSLPPHLQHLRGGGGGGGSSDDDDEDIGPRLPKIPCRGPPPSKPGVDPEEHDESSDDDFGPALPPHLANRLNPGPTSSHQEDEEDESEDDGIGPRPPQPGDSSLLLHSQMSDIERRAKNMKDKIEGKDKQEVKRETWMLELPEAKAKSFGLGPRTFTRKGITQLGDRSAWTDSPEEREKRARGEIQEKEEEESVEHIINRQRDAAMEKVTEELKKKRGTDSLLNIHEKKKKKKDKKDKKDSDGPKERRPFDRDLDLGANRFDEAQRKLMIKKAAQIDSRFSAGAQKFL